MEGRFEGIIIKFFVDIQYTGGLVRLILAVLSLIRIVDFFILDDGPFDIFLKIRYFAENSKGFIKDLFACPYCLGVWLAIPIAIMYYVNIPLFDILLIIFGLSGAHSLIEDSREK